MLITNTKNSNYQYNKPIFKEDLQSEIAKYNDKNSLKAENIANKKSTIIEKYINNSPTIVVATLGRNIFTAITDLQSQTKEQINKIKTKPQHRIVESAYRV